MDDPPDKKSEAIPKKESFEELRRILVGPEQTEIAELKSRLNAPDRRAEEVGRILPAAIRFGVNQDNRLAEALGPTVEQIVDASVRNNRDVFVNAIYPVMGPAIRKAISEAFRNMTEGLNRTLEKSLSLRGMLWRIEAARTGKSFGEVALIHSVIYRVEQVFLIHRETGLLVNHVTGESAAFQDPDMVSAMLTAIRDFVKDSFDSDRDESLDTIRMGELTVFVEQGPALMIAAVVRGNAPEDLPITLRESLEQIHDEQKAEIVMFDGDTDSFKRSRPHLENCLRARYKPRKKSPFLWLIPAALVIFAGWAGYHFMKTRMEWQRYVDRLRSENGIVVVSEEKHWFGIFHVNGLLDSLAADPDKILANYELDRDHIATRWQPYNSLEPEIVQKRARRHLDPPETVSVRIENGTIFANGKAGHAWIERFKTLAPSIPGISSYDDSQLIDSDKEEFQKLVRNYGKHIIFFEKGDGPPKPGQEDIVDRLARKTERLVTLSRLLGMRFHLKIEGRTDSGGMPEKNLAISRNRALHVKSELAKRGVTPAIMVIAGVGSNDPLREETTEAGKEYNRCVTIEIDGIPFKMGQNSGEIKKQ